MESILESAPPTVAIQTDFSRLLEERNVTYRANEYYWQVGEIERTQGWIIHLSVIKVQLESLLSIVVPFLIEINVPFKIVQNFDTAQLLLFGNLGYANLGKLVAIYPHTDEQAVFVTKKLIDLTLPFRGPVIPTDRHLGSIVHTRYGSFNPILQQNPDGSVYNCIYDYAGQLVPDPYLIPFRLPQGMKWPFEDITGPENPHEPKLLNGRFFPFHVLKPDVKGAVMKALYFKRPWQIKSCLIKQGKQNMFGDDVGRDIRDRLLWQLELHKELAAKMPLPKIIDYFEQNGNAYLAMEFVNGISLMERINILFQRNCWRDLPAGTQLELLLILKSTIDLIERLHQSQYVHRDINPYNFLVNRVGEIFLIDMELAWSMKENRPLPPFRTGTPGYMSTEQFRVETPTIKEDIFAIGGLLMAFFSNMNPTKFFNQESRKLLVDTLFFFTGDYSISQLAAKCQQFKSEDRPDLSSIQVGLGEYMERIKNDEGKGDINFHTGIGEDEIRNDIIGVGLGGLFNSNLLSIDGLWISKTLKKEKEIANEQSTLDIYPGWHTGIAGPLWLTARAVICGLAPNYQQGIYDRNCAFIEAKGLSDDGISPGLFTGKGGIALALTEGLNSGLLNPNKSVIESINRCFSNLSRDWDLENGIAGQGMALLKCSSWADAIMTETLLSTIVDTLVRSQQKDGLWHPSNKMLMSGDLSLIAYHTAGIALFLICYTLHRPQKNIFSAITSALGSLLSTEAKKRRKTKTYGNDRFILTTLTFIKGYQLTQDQRYREMAEDKMGAVQERVSLSDFSLNSGMAGLGELYLEAFDVFKIDHYRRRAGWVAQFLSHTMQTWDDHTGYWITDESTVPTADLFIGSSGVLHFLLRYVTPNILSHPLCPSIASGERNVMRSSQILIK